MNLFLFCFVVAIFFLFWRWEWSHITYAMNAIGPPLLLLLFTIQSIRTAFFFFFFYLVCAYTVFLLFIRWLVGDAFFLPSLLMQRLTRQYFAFYFATFFRSNITQYFLVSAKVNEKQKKIQTPNKNYIHVDIIHLKMNEKYIGRKWFNWWDGKEREIKSDCIYKITKRTHEKKASVYFEIITRPS